jgi:hypothetical protein
VSLDAVSLQKDEFVLPRIPPCAKKMVPKVAIIILEKYFGAGSYDTGQICGASEKTREDPAADGGDFRRIFKGGA